MLDAEVRIGELLADLPSPAGRKAGKRLPVQEGAIQVISSKIKKGAIMEAEIKSIQDELQVYKTDEIAEALGLHNETIRRWIREGRIKAKKVGKYYFIRKAEITEKITSPYPIS